MPLKIEGVKDHKGFLLKEHAMPRRMHYSFNWQKRIRQNKIIRKFEKRILDCVLQ